jgi:hypothetical protein
VLFFFYFAAIIAGRENGKLSIPPASRPPLSVVLRFRLRFTSPFVRLRRDRSARQSAFASVPPRTEKIILPRAYAGLDYQPDEHGC